MTFFFHVCIYKGFSGSFCLLPPVFSPHDKLRTISLEPTTNLVVRLCLDAYTAWQCFKICHISFLLHWVNGHLPSFPQALPTWLQRVSPSSTPLHLVRLLSWPMRQKKKKKKDEEGQGERRQVTVTLGWTVGTLRKQKLGRQNVRDQQAMFTEKGQVWMQEPKRKVAMEAQEEP